MGGVLVIAVLVPFAYLLGTFPSAQLVGRMGGRDVMTEGSGNPGASNVARLMGWKAGGFVLFADFAKGAIAAGVGYAVGGRPGAWALGVAAILGHVLPATRRFKGGKGVATTAGALVVLFPLFVAGGGVVWFAIAKGLHKASIASIVICVAFPIAAFFMGYDAIEVGVLVVLALLVIARHANNLRRLVRGEELELPRTPVPGQEDGAS